MGELVFGVGGLFIGSALGFFGRLYFEQRAEARDDAKTARHRREEQVAVIDSFLRHVEQYMWTAGLIVGGAGSDEALHAAAQGMSDSIGGDLARSACVPIARKTPGPRRTSRSAGHPGPSRPRPTFAVRRLAFLLCPASGGRSPQQEPS